MNGEREESAPSLPDLTDAPLDEILRHPDTALARAARRVLRQTAGAEPPISAYSSGGAQFFPPETAEVAGHAGHAGQPENAGHVAAVDTAEHDGR